ncbi:tRNA (adenosine(37)-N6)-threonylcarbamoyltransferase complex ATPase subunit type 1 TsaE [Aestuariibaculum sp. YM273]|uniref:tRNA (adenosine(37)-N6)-threonylcarbamoyltransferase complex ATPase subunit type 1 TsaE n=1 Tax=Aestuariibaculum sp. YM273 TaxID=3070659 RepID=UPI0027DE6D11|nr:tRNA (adenosine(37)-N6)-threonylcarbamoyltransferase complex ATPase subunit type 1 TsaE [Aestuariibaculum sp. YM273]WMI65135.1 tRNA (adenosine(37)-N6)-threonylcarbamoyltransferase complex ATPase subunit type 1 TsaE [Aestuariibaculum sp. YM273]
MEINYNLEQLDEVAQQIIKNLKTKTLLFHGEMGAGKTTLIKALIKALGSQDEVSSPTFSIVNEYELKDDKIYHFDLYRIKEAEEAYNFGIEDYLDSGYWNLIEWPDVIKDLLPSEFDILSIDIKEDNNRLLVLK